MNEIDYVAISKEIIDDYGEDVYELLPMRIQKVPSLSLSEIIEMFWTIQRHPVDGSTETQELFKKRCTMVEGVVVCALRRLEITAEERDEIITRVNFVEEFGGRIRVSLLGNIIAEATGYKIPLPVERPDLPPKRSGSDSLHEACSIILENEFAKMKEHGMVDDEGVYVDDDGHLQGPEGPIKDANLRPDELKWITTPQGWTTKLTPPEDNGDGLSPEDKAIKGLIYAIDAVLSTLDTKDNDSFKGQMSPDHPEYDKYVRARHAGIVNIVQNLGSGIRGKTKNDMRGRVDRVLEEIGMTGYLTGGQKKKLYSIAAQYYSKLTLGNNLGNRNIRDAEAIVNRETFLADIVETLESYNLEEFRRLLEGVIEEGWTTVGRKEGRAIDTILILIGLAVQTGKSRVCLRDMTYGMMHTGAKFGGYMVVGKRDAAQFEIAAISDHVASYERLQEFIKKECKKLLKPSVFEELFSTQTPGQPTIWQRYMPEYEAWTVEHKHNSVKETLSQVGACTNIYKRYVMIFNANHTQIPKITNWINTQRRSGLPVPKSIYCQDEADDGQKTNDDITGADASTKGHEVTNALYTLIKDPSVERFTFSTATGAKLIQNFTYMDGVIYFPMVCKRETGDTLVVSVQDATEGKSVAERVPPFSHVIKELFSGNENGTIKGAPLKNDGHQQRQTVLPSNSKDLHPVMTWHSTGMDCNSRAEISGMYADEFAKKLNFDVLNTTFQKSQNGSRILHIRSSSEGDINARFAEFLQEMGGVSMSKLANGLTKFHDGPSKDTALYGRANGPSMAMCTVMSDLKTFTENAKKNAKKNSGFDDGLTIKALQQIALDCDPSGHSCNIVREQFKITSDRVMIELGEVYIECAIVARDIARNIAESIWQQRHRTSTMDPATGLTLTSGAIRQHLKELGEIANRGSYNHALKSIRSNPKSLSNISVENAPEQLVMESLPEVVYAVAVALSNSRKGLLSMKDMVNTDVTKKKMISAAVLKQGSDGSGDPLLGAIGTFAKEVAKNAPKHAAKMRSVIKKQTVFEIKVNKTHNPGLDLGHLIGMAQVFVRYHLKRTLPYNIIPDIAMNRGLSWCINLGNADNRYFRSMVNYLENHHLEELDGEAPGKVIQDLNYTCPLTGQILDGIENRTMESIEQMIRSAARVNKPTTLFEDKAFLLTTHRSYESLLRANVNTEQNMQNVFEYGCHYDGIMANGKKTIHYSNNKKECQKRVVKRTFVECTDQEVLENMGRVSDECKVRLPKKHKKAGAAAHSRTDTDENLGKLEERVRANTDENKDTVLNRILHAFKANKLQPMAISDLMERVRDFSLKDFTQWEIAKHNRYNVLERLQNEEYAVRNVIQQRLSWFFES